VGQEELRQPDACVPENHNYRLAIAIFKRNVRLNRSLNKSIVDQKEGNGNINMGLFAQFSKIVFTSEIVHHKGVMFVLH
jgi:hypothetical protein